MEVIGGTWIILLVRSINEFQQRTIGFSGYGVRSRARRKGPDRWGRKVDADIRMADAAGPARKGARGSSDEGERGQ